ncbi:MAG: head-tail joining protein [Rhizobium sp.]|nr:head-tail joining protein [Rhizobium sp.]
MPVETDADRLLFVAENDFAVSVAWVHSGGTATFSAIFDDDYRLLPSEFLDGGAEGSAPQILAVSAEVPTSGKQGDALTVNARTYAVVEIKPDGTGMSIIRVQEG